MDKNTLVALAEKFTGNAPSNYVAEEDALSPDCIGMKMFEAPIFAIGAPDDKIFERFKNPGIIGSHFMAPLEWLPGAKSVISFFVPYTKRIKNSNAADFLWPSDEWLHGRTEGFDFTKELVLHIMGLLMEAGHKSVAPYYSDDRFKTGAKEDKYTSNWSERHIAFACGLGTFGLSAGLITEKGLCGRFCSIVTELDLPKDSRGYTDAYEYCTMCYLCIPHCPSGAISETGKDKELCSAFLGKTTERYKPRYGCGKCQVAVPCEGKRP